MYKLLLFLYLFTTDTTKFKVGDTVYHIHFHKKFVIEKVQKRKWDTFYLGWTLNCKEWEWLGQKSIKK